MAGGSSSGKAHDMNVNKACVDEVDAFSALYEKIMDELETTDDGECGTFSRKRKPRHKMLSQQSHVRGEVKLQVADSNVQEKLVSSPAKTTCDPLNCAHSTDSGHVPINSLDENTITTTKNASSSETQGQLESKLPNKHSNKTEHASNYNSGELNFPEHLGIKQNKVSSNGDVTQSPIDGDTGSNKGLSSVTRTLNKCPQEDTTNSTGGSSPEVSTDRKRTLPGVQSQARDTSNLEKDNLEKVADIICDNKDNLRHTERSHLTGSDLNADIYESNTEIIPSASAATKNTTITVKNLSVGLHLQNDPNECDSDVGFSKPQSNTEVAMNGHNPSFSPSSSPSKCGDTHTTMSFSPRKDSNGDHDTCTLGGTLPPHCSEDVQKSAAGKNDTPCAPLCRLDVTICDRVWALRASDMSDFPDADTDSISSFSSQDTIMTLSSYTERAKLEGEWQGSEMEVATSKNPSKTNIEVKGGQTHAENTLHEIDKDVFGPLNDDNENKIAYCHGNITDSFHGNDAVREKISEQTHIRCLGNEACRETFCEQTKTDNNANTVAACAATFADAGNAVRYLRKTDVSLQSADSGHQSKQHVKTPPVEPRAPTAIKTNFGYVDRSKVPSFRQMNAELRKSLTDMAGAEAELRCAEGAQKSPKERSGIENTPDIDAPIAENPERKETPLTTPSPEDGIVHVKVSSAAEVQACHDRGSVSRADKVLPRATNDTSDPLHKSGGEGGSSESHESCQGESGQLIEKTFHGHGEQHRYIEHLNGRRGGDSTLNGGAGGEVEDAERNGEERVECGGSILKTVAAFTDADKDNNTTNADCRKKTPLIATSRDASHCEGKASKGSRSATDIIRTSPRKDLGLSSSNINQYTSELKFYSEAEPVWVPLVAQTYESKSLKKETTLTTVNIDIQRAGAGDIRKTGVVADDTNESALNARLPKDFAAGEDSKRSILNICLKKDSGADDPKKVHEADDDGCAVFNSNLKDVNITDHNKRSKSDTLKNVDSSKRCDALDSRGSPYVKDDTAVGKDEINITDIRLIAELKGKRSDLVGSQNVCSADPDAIKPSLDTNRKRSKSETAANEDIIPEVTNAQVKSVSTQAFIQFSQPNISPEELGVGGDSTGRMLRPKSSPVPSVSSENADSNSTASTDSTETAELLMYSLCDGKMPRRDSNHRGVPGDKENGGGVIRERGRPLQKNRNNNVNKNEITSKNAHEGGINCKNASMKAEDKKLKSKMKKSSSAAGIKARQKLAPLDCSRRLDDGQDLVPTRPGENAASRTLETETRPPSPKSPGDHLNSMLDQMVQHLKDINTSGSIENIYKFSQLQLPNFDKYKEKTRNKSASPEDKLLNTRRNMDEVDTLERRRRARSMDSRPRQRNDANLSEKKENVKTLNRARSRDDVLGETAKVETLRQVDELPAFLRSISTQTSKRYDEEAAKERGNLPSTRPQTITATCHMPHKGTCDVEKLEQYARNTVTKKTQPHPNGHRLFRRHTTTTANYPRRPWLPTEDFFQKEKMKTLGPYSSLSREFTRGGTTVAANPSGDELEKFIARDSHRMEKIRQRYKSSPEMRINELESIWREKNKHQVGGQLGQHEAMFSPELEVTTLHAPVSPADVRKRSLLNPETYSPRPRRSALPASSVNHHVPPIAENGDNDFQNSMAQPPLAQQPRYCSKYELHMEKPRNFADQARSFTNRCLQLLHKGKQKKTTEGSKMETHSPANAEKATSKARCKTSVRKFHSSRRNEPLAKKTYSSPDISLSDYEFQAEACKSQYETVVWLQPSASQDSILRYQHDAEFYQKCTQRQPCGEADLDFEDVFVPPWGERSPPDGAPSNSPRDSAVMDGDIREDDLIKCKKLRPKSCYV